MNATAATARPLVLVDDEALFVDLLSEQLSAHYSRPVHTFYRPQAALEALESLQPACVVTDFSMPGLDGLEFLRRAAEIVPDAHAFVITGTPFELGPEHFRACPILRGLVAKPFTWRELAKQLSAHWPSRAERQRRAS